MAAWNLIGGAYEAANPMQDDQTLINWYVEIDRNKDAKSPLALLGCPGLSAVNTSYSGEVRGVHVMPGGATAYWVIGSTLVKMTISSMPTASAPAVFAFMTIGTIGSTTGQVCMRDNGVAGVLAIVDGTSMWVYMTKTGVLQRCPDPNVINPSRIAEIDGYFIWNSVGTQKFNVSPAYWNGTDAFDGTWFALKDDAPDNLVTLIEHQRQLWLIGESTTEVWVNAGSSSVTGVASQPFARLEGAMLQVGCGAPNTIVRTGPSLMWLGSSERGQNYVVQTQGYLYQVISNPALSYALTQYNVTADAFAFTYTEEGHEFFVMTFPTQDVNWTYDMTTGFWHQRQSIDSYGQTHRQRANCIASIAGQRLVGDYENGTIWQQSRKFYSDGGSALIASRRSPYVWDGSDRNRVRNYRLQVEFTPGVGLATGQGSAPVMMLRWRDEKGWSNQQFIPIGAIGNTANRAIARRLGASRFRVYEVSISDPVPRDVVGASLRAAETAA